jgi:hypothetical protein
MTGAFLTMFGGIGNLAANPLLLLKTALDALAHLRLHRRLLPADPLLPAP